MFTQHTIALPNGPIVLRRAPGIPIAEKATAALLSAARRSEGARVFVMGPGITAAAVWAARSGAAITAWTENAAEAETLRATFEAEKLSPPQLHLQDDFAGLDPSSCDMALCHLPRGRALQIEAWKITAAVLRPGGRLVFSGATHEGISSTLADAKNLFGRVGIVVRKGGYHAGLAERPPIGEFQFPELRYETHTVVVEGVPTEVVGATGVFAADRLDMGAAALIAGMQIEARMRVLELGCGTGLVTLTALRHDTDAVAVDVSARAVTATRRTLAANGYPDAQVQLSIGAAAIAGQRFDVVLANPPFHKGHEVDMENARLFITDARKALAPQGKLYLVANAFLKYKGWLKDYFAHVRCVWEDSRFRVWEASV
ncbi:MAG: methyltransferase [Anaerolineae bacterium]|nr:methyltransferase [Anaerolineae bacterium]